MLGVRLDPAPAPGFLAAALAPGAERLVLVPYDLAPVFEPAVARAPAGSAGPARPPASPGLPVVVQTLGGVTPAARAGDGAFSAGPLALTRPREAYADAVRAALGLIAAGDAYQVNLCHHLTAPFRGDALALYRRLAAGARPAHAGFLCWDDPAGVRHAVLSLSPERFFDYDPATRLVRTKPMKGTRPIDADPAELDASEKDRAELNMIVDLMRNDLGRVAVPGTVRVTRPRDVDAHAGSVWQATATVEARLRDDRAPADLLAACFPPGSVTGAPKIRACQIIRDLEPSPRGPYCGTLIRVHADGRLDASVLIRTAHLQGTPDPADPHGFLDARLDFPVGAGIVADSDPDAEWRETLTKARVLTDALGLVAP